MQDSLLLSKKPGNEFKFLSQMKGPSTKKETKQLPLNRQILKPIQLWGAAANSYILY